MLRRLDNVDDKVKAFFAPAAKAVLDNSDAHNALAAALAALSGIIEVPKQRRCTPAHRVLNKHASRFTAICSCNISWSAQPLSLTSSVYYC